MYKWEDRTKEENLELVKKNGDTLQYVKNQTEEICLDAVKQDAYALQFVKNQTEEICLEAVKQDGYALQIVKNQTEEICLAAVKRSGWALQYVEKFYPSLLELESDYMKDYKKYFAKEIEEYEKATTKEMTIKQLEEEVGYKIKIIKE